MIGVMSIHAVVFDYGGVISLTPEPGALEELAALVGVTREELEPTLWGLRANYDRGTISGKDYYHQVLSQLHREVDEAALEGIIQFDLDCWKNINPDTVRLMEDSKAWGLKLGILSNMPEGFLRMARESIPAFRLPDVGIFSCDLKSIKPEERIYQALFEALDMEPPEILFFDDTWVNVEKARELGMKAFLWEGADRAREILAKEGIGG